MTHAPWIVALLLASASSSQSPAARARLGGIVRDAAGRPWTGVEVVLHAPGPEGQGDFVDTVRVRTDDRGRFSARLLRDRDYVAWAAGAGDDGDRFRATGLGKDVRPGRPIRLDEIGVFRRRRLTLRNAQRWGALRAAVYVDDSRFVLVPVGRRPETWVLPPLPVAEPSVALLDATGCSVWRGRFAERNEQLVDLPDRRQVWIRARARRAGRAVAGCRVLRECTAVQSWIPVGTTDRDGRLAVAFASPMNWSGLLALHAEGFAESIKCVVTRGETIGEGDEIAIDLVQEPSFTGRLTVGGKVAAHGTELFLRAPGSDGERLFANLGPRRTAIDSGGRFVVPRPRDAPRVEAGSYALFAILGTETWARLGGERHALARHVLLRLGHTHDHLLDPAVTQFGDVALDRVRHVDVVVLRADDSPLPFAPLVLVAPSEGSIYERALDLVTRANRAGRARLLLPEQELILGVRSEAGIGSVRLDAEGDPGRVTLRLSSSVLVRGKVVNGDGKGVFALVDWRPKKGWDRDLMTLAGPLFRRSRRTAADGTFELRLPVGSSTYEVTARASGGRCRHLLRLGRRDVRELTLVAAGR